MKTFSYWIWCELYVPQIWQWILYVLFICMVMYRNRTSIHNQSDNNGKTNIPQTSISIILFLFSALAVLLLLSSFSIWSFSFLWFSVLWLLATSHRNFVCMCVRLCVRQNMQWWTRTRILSHAKYWSLFLCGYRPSIALWILQKIPFGYWKWFWYWINFPFQWYL